MAGAQQIDEAKAGRRVALFLAGVGMFWILATFAGQAMGLSQRLRALFDLLALAGFGWALWMTIDIWRKRRDNGRDVGHDTGQDIGHDFGRNNKR